MTDQLLEIPGLPAGANPSEWCNLDRCPLSLANFHYVPSLGGNLSYAGFFGLLLIFQLFLGAAHRTWGFLAGMSVGLVVEIIGYAARVQLHHNPFPFDPFLMQLICLTIAPAFLCAAIYLCLGRIVVAYGKGASWLRPRTYTYVFVGCDFVSLVLQGAGGGITATADDKAASDVGVNVMIAGLVFQVVALAAFMALCGWFAFRIRSHPELRNHAFADLTRTFQFRCFLGGLGLAVVLIFVRCAYRVAELSEGFSGELANDELLFMILEGPMLMAACFCLTVFHPGPSFGGRWAEAHPSKDAGSGYASRGSKRGSESADDSDIELARGPEAPIDRS